MAEELFKLPSLDLFSDSSDEDRVPIVITTANIDVVSSVSPPKLLVATEKNNNKIKQVLLHHKFFKRIILPKGEIYEVERDFSFLENLQVLELKCEEAPTEFLKGCRFQNLSKMILHNGEITTLPNEIFQGCPNLEVLDLYSNKIENVSPGAFKGLKKAKKLFLGDNKVRQLEIGTFDDLTSLETLYIRENQLESLPVGLLKKCNYLTNFDVCYNKIRIIPRGLFTSVLLQEISLGCNQIEIIDDGAFDGLDKLKCLGLGNNLLQDIPFLKNENLKHLFLDGNQIRTIKKNAFVKTKNLKRLYLKDNQICDMEEGCFSGLHKLRSLDLEDNEITIVRRGFFKDMSISFDLNLRSNKIEEIEDGAFEDLQTLSYLSLANNRPNLRSEIFIGLKALKTLDLDYCELGEVDNIFQHVPALETLYLNNNKLKKLSFDVLSSLKNLSRVQTRDDATDAAEPVELTHVDLEESKVDEFLNKYHTLEALNLPKKYEKEIEEDASGRKILKLGRFFIYLKN